MMHMRLLLLACALVVYTRTALADPGLGGLGAAYALYAIVLTILGVGILVVLPGIIKAIRLKKAGQADGRLYKLLRILVVAYLLITAPLFVWALIAIEAGIGAYLITAVFVCLCSASVYLFSVNRKLALGCAAALVVTALMNDARLISFTRTVIVDNVALDSNIELAEQKDEDYIHLADGRILRVEQRYDGFPREVLLDRNSRFRIESTSADSQIMKFYGHAWSQPYIQQMRDIKSLITIPLITKTIEQNVAKEIGSVRVLDSGWLADRRALDGAVIHHCCNPAWIQELISRGANARLDLNGGGNLLHWLAGRPPYGADIEQTAGILFHSGADINGRDDQGRTPLHVAIHSIQRDAFNVSRMTDAHRSFLRLLLTSGANANLPDKSGNTPLRMTIPAKFYEISRLLLENGANPRFRNHQGQSAYGIATMYLNEQKAVLSDAEEEELAALIADMLN